MTVPTANTEPIWPAKPANSANNSTGTGRTYSPVFTLAANDYTGAGANNQLIFTAGADGAVLEGFRATATGTNVASLVRFFGNNGGLNTIAGNNWFIGELSLQSTTASATAANPSPELRIPMVLDAGERVYAGLGTAVAAGWQFSPIRAGQF